MAEYYIAPKSSFDATANAIREKTGSQTTIEWTEDGFADAVGAIPTSASVSEVTISTTGDVTQALNAGTIYHFTGALSSLTLTLNAAATGQLAQYHFDFTTGSTAPTLTVPNTVTMPDGFDVKANKRYEIDILNGYGAVMSWTIS